MNSFQYAGTFNSIILYWLRGTVYLTRFVYFLLSVAAKHDGSDTQPERGSDYHDYADRQ